MEIKHETLTRGIANKGFSCMRRFVARFNFSCNLTGDTPAIPYWPYRHPLSVIRIKLYETKNNLILYFIFNNYKL